MLLLYCPTLPPPTALVFRFHAITYRPVAFVSPVNTPQHLHPPHTAYSPMRATQSERVRELETAIALREHEIETLESQKEELQSQMAVTTPALRQDPLLASFPVLDYCGRKPRKQILSVPVEQVGNIMSQFDIANRTISQQNRKDESEIAELRRLLREQEKRHRQWSGKARKLSDDAGIDMAVVSSKGCEGVMQLQAYESEASLQELAVRKQLIEKEIRAGNLVTHKKGNAIATLSTTIDARRAIIDEIDDMYNKIRVVDRDTTVELERIEKLNAGIEENHDFAAEKRNGMDSVSRVLIEQDVADIRTEKTETVNNRRIPQERVVKAQDYRLAQLEKRLKAIDTALVNNHLDQGVEKILANNWAFNTIDVSEDKEEMYDIEHIIPAQEKVHPGVYNLFLTEKETTHRTVSVLNIGAKEKEEVIAAMAVKLDALCQQYNLCIQELDVISADATFAEEAQRKQALMYVQEQRKYYEELQNEKHRLGNTQ